MSAERIRASVLHGVKDLRVEERLLSAPEHGELQIAIRSTGLCGSDLHYYNHFRNGDIIVQEPLSLGHESAGVVVRIGTSVDGFSIGDKVALEVGIPCEQCELCKKGRYNICKQMRFRSSAKAVPHAQGTLQERINHPSKWCHKLPNEMPSVYGALLEPMAVAVHAMRRSKIHPESNVLIFGAGTIGLLCGAMARLWGAKTVVITDINPGRTKFAVDHKFADVSHVVAPRRGGTVKEELQIAAETADSLAAVNNVGQFDFAFECTGIPSCLQASIYATKPGGRVVLIGMGTPIQTLPISAAALREVDLVGVFRYASTYEEAISILNEREIDGPEFGKLITHRFSGLDSVPEAFAMAGRIKDDSGNLVLKVMIETPD